MPLLSYKETRREEKQLERRAERETRAEHMLSKETQRKEQRGMPSPAEASGNFSSSFMELGPHTGMKILLDRNRDRHRVSALQPCMGMPLWR